jgi:hypothetical protein
MDLWPEWHAFDDNQGWAMAQKKHHKKQHKRPDIAERGMDEEVHGFVKEAIPPLNTRVRSSDAFVPNGSDSSAFEGAAFSETKHHKKHNKHHKWGVADRDMDPYVHGFVSGALKDHISEHRSITPHVPNGSDPKAFEGSATLSQKKHNKHQKWGVSD